MDQPLTPPRKYKGFEIRKEYRTNVCGGQDVVFAIYRDNKLLTIASFDAAKHVIVSKIKTGEWKFD